MAFQQQMRPFSFRTPTESRMRRITKRLLASSFVVAAGWWFVQQANAAVEFGQASVQSQQGQKLKVWFPYSSNPGERPSINRFSVESATLPDGRKISPRDFSLLAPMNRNAVLVQSRDAVYAPNIQLVMNVSNQANSAQTFDLKVPASAASTAASPEAVKKVVKKRGKYKGKPVAKAKRIKAKVAPKVL